MGGEWTSTRLVGGVVYVAKEEEDVEQYRVETALHDNQATRESVQYKNYLPLFCLAYCSHDVVLLPVGYVGM